MHVYYTYKLFFDSGNLFVQGIACRLAPPVLVRTLPVHRGVLPYQSSDARTSAFSSRLFWSSEELEDGRQFFVAGESPHGLLRARQRIGGIH